MQPFHILFRKTALRSVVMVTKRFAKDCADASVPSFSNQAFLPHSLYPQTECVSLVTTCNKSRIPLMTPADAKIAARQKIPFITSSESTRFICLSLAFYTFNPPRKSQMVKKELWMV